MSRRSIGHLRDGLDPRRWLGILAVRLRQSEPVADLDTVEDLIYRSRLCLSADVLAGYALRYSAHQ